MCIHIYIYIYIYIWPTGGGVRSSFCHWIAGRRLAWRGAAAHLLVMVYRQVNHTCSIINFVKTIVNQLNTVYIHHRYTIIRKGGAQIVQFELFELKCLNSSFSSLSSCWN